MSAFLWFCAGALVASLFWAGFAIRSFEIGVEVGQRFSRRRP